MKVLSGKNIASSFENTEHKETRMPGLSGQKRGIKKPSFLISGEGFIALV
jgi:hypothetical protein